MNSVGSMNETSAIAPSRRRLPFDTQADGCGYVCGCILALGASLSFAAARAGILRGLTPADLILMRFGTAGIVLLPLLVRWGLAGIGWRRVIHPASVTILSTGIAASLLAERLSQAHLNGAGLVIAGMC